MDEQLNNANELPVHNNNFLLVCGMLSLYAVCILVSFGAIIGVLQYEKQAYTVNVTSTAFTAATQNADAEATAIARSTEHSQYEFIERFEEVSARWYVGPSAKQYGDMQYSIEDGIYIWDVREAKDSSFSVDFYKRNLPSNFDVYLDARFMESESLGSVCTGLAFRKERDDWGKGAFAFYLCNDAHFEVHFYDRNGWSPVTHVNISDVFQPEDWNRIEIQARGDHFSFVINHVEFFEMTDDRLTQGDLCIYLYVAPNESAEVWFDNFGYQSR